MGAAACEIHWARVGSLPAASADVLDASERARAATMDREGDRRRFMLAAVLLRVLAGRLLGIEPHAVQVDRTCPRCGEPHGRPRIPQPGPELSISHSGEFVAVAMSDAGPVGVDVERIRPLDFRAVGRSVFTANELSSAADAATFFALWTRKESVLKAAGVGLRFPMAAVRVTPADEPPRLLRLGDATRPARIADVAPAAGYAGAVTVMTSAPVAFVVSDAEALLARLA